MSKSRDAFRTISEVADWLGTPTHVLRFWESRFAQVKPVKRAGGRRYYRPGDMALLGGIKKLLHDDGLTIRGVQKILREEGVKHVAAMSPEVDRELSEADALAPTAVSEDPAPSHTEVDANSVESGAAAPSAPEPEAPSPLDPVTETPAVEVDATDAPLALTQEDAVADGDFPLDPAPIDPAPPSVEPTEAPRNMQPAASSDEAVRADADVPRSDEATGGGDAPTEPAFGAEPEGAVDPTPDEAPAPAQPTFSLGKDTDRFRPDEAEAVETQSDDTQFDDTQFDDAQPDDAQPGDAQPEDIAPDSASDPDLQARNLEELPAFITRDPAARTIAPESDASAEVAEQPDNAPASAWGRDETLTPVDPEPETSEPELEVTPADMAATLDPVMDPDPANAPDDDPDPEVAGSDAPGFSSTIPAPDFGLTSKDVRATEASDPEPNDIAYGDGPLEESAPIDAVASALEDPASDAAAPFDATPQDVEHQDPAPSEPDAAQPPVDMPDLPSGPPMSEEILTLLSNGAKPDTAQLGPLVARLQALRDRMAAAR